MTIECSYKEIAFKQNRKLPICYTQVPMNCDFIYLWERSECSMVQNIFDMGLQISYYSMSSGVGKGASERVSAVEPANEASSAEQANECLVRAIE